MQNKLPMLSILMKSFREANGMTQDDICDELNIEKSTLSRWENGSSKPTGRETIARIKKLYKISDQQLLELFTEWNVVANNRAERKGYHILSHMDAHVLGLDFAGIMQRMIEIDYETLPGADFNHVGDLDQWLPIMQSLPYTWRLLEYDGTIVGYWSYEVLNDRTFAKIKQGELEDHEITLGDIVIPDGLDPQRTYNMYVSSVTIEQAHRDPITGGMLINSLMREITRLAEGGIFFSEICAVTFSVQAASICKNLGFRKIGAMKNLRPGQSADVYLITGGEIAQHGERSHQKLAKIYSRFFG